MKKSSSGPTLTYQRSIGTLATIVTLIAAASVVMGCGQHRPAVSDGNNVSVVSASGQPIRNIFEGLPGRETVKSKLQRELNPEPQWIARLENFLGFGVVYAQSCGGCGGEEGQSYNCIDGSESCGTWTQDYDGGVLTCDGLQSTQVCGNSCGGMIFGQVCSQPPGVCSGC